MTGTTSPDGLRYPNNYGDPADVPNAMQALATDTQVALNKKMLIAASKVNLGRAANWGNSFPTASKSGKLVVLSDAFQRSAGSLTVAANTAYNVGSLPAGYRPAIDQPAPCVWSVGGVRRFGMLLLGVGGDIDWTPTTAATMTSDDWVSVGGIAFMTP